MRLKRFDERDGGIVLVKIAVSGHRQLSDCTRLEASILAAAGRIKAVYPKQRYQVFSCLAEGADRLLTRILVETLSADLTIVLPLPEPDYLQDFETNESIEEYQSLMLLSEKVIEPGPGLTRPQAYQDANRFLVKVCDLLVAIWDGTPARGEGGTGEMVAMSRQVSRPVLWIHTGPGPVAGSLTEERFGNLPIE
jgi:hypothetical protein